MKKILLLAIVAFSALFATAQNVAITYDAVQLQSIGGAKSVYLKKATTLPVNRIVCRKTGSVVIADYYSVVYKGSTYKLKVQDAAQCSLPNFADIYNETAEKRDKVINTLTKIGGRLSDSLELWQAQVELYVSNKKLEYYTQETERRDSIFTAQTEAFYKRFPKTEGAVKLLEILENDVKEPNSAGGCDYKLVYVNKADKAIKYLRWYGKVINTVGDPAYCSVRMTEEMKGMETGPILPNEVGGGEWECIIYNRASDYMRLDKIEITYMDGSVKIIDKDGAWGLMYAPKKDFSTIEYRNYRADCVDLNRKMMNAKKEQLSIQTAIKNLRAISMYDCKQFEVSTDMEALLVYDNSIRDLITDFNESAVRLQQYPKDNVLIL